MLFLNFLKFRKMHLDLRSLGHFALCVAPLFLVACSNYQSPGSGSAEFAGISGSVFGGLQPIAGSRIQLYAAGTAEDGSPATPLLLEPAISDNTGAFHTGGFSCPSMASELYLVATGGNPGLGGGEVNPRIALMTALGACVDVGAVTKVEINEVTTVAATSALASYMHAYDLLGAVAEHAQTISDSFRMAAELASAGSGKTPGASVPEGHVVPSRKLNTLGNILSACVNSSGGLAGDSTPCGRLFSLASEASGRVPTDTIGALLEIAQSPDSNVASIFNLNPPSEPFEPALSAAPLDWKIEITSPTLSPVFSPSPGAYTALSPITLTAANPSATIYYTTDGSIPNASSIPYSGAIVLPGTATIRAVAIAGGISSLLAAGSYVLKPGSVDPAGSEPSLPRPEVQGAYTAGSSLAANGKTALVSTVSVALSPGTATVATSKTLPFITTVNGTSNKSVTWTLSPAVGNISASGLYTAPSSMPSSATVTITATSASDRTKAASATVTIVPSQAAGYTLAWQDTFSKLNVCSTNSADCNWWRGVWGNPNPPGAVTDPQGTYADLNWVNTQATSDTDLTTASSNGAYYHAWTYGYFEVSMAFNDSTGNWPAIWMRPVSSIGSGPANGGELDVFEWQSQSSHTGFSTVHVWQNGTDIANNNSSNARTIPAGTNLANFNTYGVLWTPTKISWYLNNVLVNTVSTVSGPYATAFGKQQSYFLILSEQAGCNWTYAKDAPCKGQANPLNMKVQWVHVFQPPA
jgi:hypothetical protein